jgi:hypothetical protein
MLRRLRRSQPTRHRPRTIDHNVTARLRAIEGQAQGLGLRLASPPETEIAISEITHRCQRPPVDQNAIA